MHRLSAALVALLLVIPAGLSAQEAAPQEQKKIKRNPDVISVEEIDAAGTDMRTAEDLVSRLRPNWMRKSRGETSIHLQTPEPVVFVNEVRRGPLSTLKEINRTLIKEIRHLRGTDATQRFGPTYGGGAVLVYLR